MREAIQKTLQILIKVKVDCWKFAASGQVSVWDQGGKELIQAMQSPCFSLLLDLMLTERWRHLPWRFEDSKYNFLGPADHGFPDFYLNALEPEAESEAIAQSSEIYIEFSRCNILARRSADAEPEVEAEPIDKSLFKFNNVYYPEICRNWTQWWCWRWGWIQIYAIGANDDDDNSYHMLVVGGRPPD